MTQILMKKDETRGKNDEDERIDDEDLPQDGDMVLHRIIEQTKEKINLIMKNHQSLTNSQTINLYLHLQRRKRKKYYSFQSRKLLKRELIMR